MAIQQGDQYKIEVTIKFNNSNVTPSTSNLEDVRIQFGSYLKEYSKNEIEYNTEINKWLFPMTEKMSREFCGVVTMQVGVKFTGDQWKYASNQILVDDNSIITESWA